MQTKYAIDNLFLKGREKNVIKVLVIQYKSFFSNYFLNLGFPVSQDSLFKVWEITVHSGTSDSETMCPHQGPASPTSVKNEKNWCGGNGMQLSTFKNDDHIFASVEKPTNNPFLDLCRKYWFVLNIGS